MRNLAFAIVVAAPILACLLAAAAAFFLHMPGKSHPGPPPAGGAEERELASRLRGHVEKLATEIGERNFDHPEALEAAARYVESSLHSFGYAVGRQTVDTWGEPLQNLEAEIPGSSLPDEIVIIGAHYDSVQGSPGANDNASGVAALLELARYAAGRRYDRTLRFVAFVNEEPPFFQTERMGSLVYARRSHARGEGISAMISLETLGCYRDEPGSQTYPPLLGLLYPDRGDFVAFVANLGSRGLVRRAVRVFRRSAPMPSEGIAAPRSIPGVAWSDQWAFWLHGHPAIMVTDTAPFRYRHYHSDDDTAEKLDYPRMALVVVGMRAILEDLGEA